MLRANGLEIGPRAWRYSWGKRTHALEKAPVAFAICNFCFNLLGGPTLALNPMLSPLFYNTHTWLQPQTVVYSDSNFQVLVLPLTGYRSLGKLLKISVPHNTLIFKVRIMIQSLHYNHV